MQGRIGSLLLSAMTLLALSITASAQSNLTAKANTYQPPAPAVVESDRVRDGLMGPVRRVRTEIAKLVNESGKMSESKHAVLEVAAYDIKGKKTENQYFPVAGANLTGKEVYKYDEKGNISEMTLLNADGSLLSKEIYKYEFDFAGNWNKMTTAVAVIEGGKMAFEPTEVTYRSIMYYLDESMMKLAQPATQPVSQPPAAPSNNVAGAKLDTKASDVPTGPAKNNSRSTQKQPVSLPSSGITADKLNNTNSVGLASPQLEANVPNGGTMKMESEPPPPAPRPILKPVSGGVLNGTAINLPAPLYPEAARRLRVTGIVVVEVVVDETGKVISAQATGGPNALRDVAVAAALRARFSPTKLSGQPVKVSGVINYKFAIAP